MKDLLVLRDLLAGAEVPKEVIAINCTKWDGWSVHLQEADFRAAFSVFDHIRNGYHPGKKRDDYRLTYKTSGVTFFCLTDEAPQTDAEIIARESPYQYDRQANLASVRDEVLAGDLVANNRRAR